MRILYFVYSRQLSFKEFTENRKTNLPWVDSMLDTLLKSESITIGLSVIAGGNSLQRVSREKITFYGMPIAVNVTLLGRIYRRIVNSYEEVEMNSIMERVIEDFNPDIIQVFGTENPFGLVVTKTQTPIVIHFQGSAKVVLVKWFTGLSKWEQFWFSEVKNIILMRGCYSEYFSFRRKAEREQRIMQKCRYFIGRTKFDKRLISLLSPDSRYFHCEEFIREEFFRDNWNLPLDRKIRSVSILKGVTYKGIDLLVETLAVFQKYSSVSIEFLVCGVGEEEEVVGIIKRKYRRRVDFSRIRFLGKLNANSLVGHLTSSHFFVHPSYMENSSNSICEAMALGMPVIATNVGGTSSLIRDGVDGLLVQEGDPFALASALNVLINDSEYAISLGKRARERAISRHTANYLSDKLVEIYGKIRSDSEKKIKQNAE